VKVKIGGRISNTQVPVGQYIGAVVLFSVPSGLHSLSEISKIYYEDQPSRVLTVRQTISERDEGKTFVIETSPFPTHCSAEGPALHGGEIGIPTHFIINTKKEEGGGFPSHVRVNGPSTEVEASLTETENNSYAVEFRPIEGGEHTVSVTFSVTASIPVHIGKWVADPIQCIAFGPGLEGGEQYKPTEFYIEARNKLGDKIPVGGHNFIAKVIDPIGGEIPASIEDNGDGTYTASYCPWLPGVHTIEVRLNADLIKDSPFKVPIDDSSEVANAALSYAEGPGLEDNANNSSQKTPAVFTIHAVDRDGIEKKVGGDLFDVLIEDPNFDILTANVKDNNNGTYTVEYSPHEPGPHHISVVLRNKMKTLNYEHITDSPKDVTIKAGIDPSHCIAEGPGLKNGIYDTYPAEFTIYAKDRDDQPINEGGDDFHVKILDPQGHECPVEIRDNGDGTYGVLYQPDGAGPYTVNVTLDDTPIKDMPKTIQIKPGAWARNCFLKNFNFVVRSRDKRDDDIPEGGQDIRVKIVDPKEKPVSVKLTDRKDGSYLVNYDLPQVEGKYRVHVTVVEEDIKGSPFVQTVENLQHH